MSLKNKIESIEKRVQTAVDNHIPYDDNVAKKQFMESLRRQAAGAAKRLGIELNFEDAQPVTPEIREMIARTAGAYEKLIRRDMELCQK